MKIKVEIQPGHMMDLDARPEEYEGKDGWWITLPDGDKVFFYYSEGFWQVSGTDRTLDLKFIKRIGKGIKSSDTIRQS